MVDDLDFMDHDMRQHFIKREKEKKQQEMLRLITNTANAKKTFNGNFNIDKETVEDARKFLDKYYRD